HKIEIELIVKRNVDRAARRDQEERMAVRGSPHRRLGSDCAASAGTIVDYKGLAEPLRQPLSDRACQGVSWPARQKWHDPANRPRRVGFRPSRPWHDRQ